MSMIALMREHAIVAISMPRNTVAYKSRTCAVSNTPAIQKCKKSRRLFRRLLNFHRLAPDMSTSASNRIDHARAVHPAFEGLQLIKWVFSRRTSQPTEPTASVTKDGRAVCHAAAQSVTAGRARWLAAGESVDGVTPRRCPLRTAADSARPGSGSGPSGPVAA